jgi:hypothetical protein
MWPWRVHIRKSSWTGYHSVVVQWLICFFRGDLRVALDLYRKAETYVPGPDYMTLIEANVIQGVLRVFRRETGLDAVTWALALPDVEKL